ncbi:hypothetical protein K7432_001735 [Basidiobolus ranarum]|uniref:Rab-like protein 6 n=1 Tax=Basidiobolus ranarum TaxID=34480 RepID=A0ABR2W905_9FUNG
MGNEQAKPVLDPSAHLRTKQLTPMPSQFRKGIRYNMKLVIRGDTMTGKTALFNMLQGSKFEPDYQTTANIQVANLKWKYDEASEDIIKVELWDVVDYGVKAVKDNVELKFEEKKLNINDISSIPSSASRTPTSESPVPPDLLLDAQTVNVYRNTHGAILMFDITKPWTFEYVSKELKNIPDGLTVLIVGNHADEAQKRSVQLSDIINLIAKFNLKRKNKEGSAANVIRYVESSLKTGQGLKYIYKFFGVPFLTLQKEVLRKQMEQKEEEMGRLLSELDNSEDAMFKNRMNFAGDGSSEDDSDTECIPDQKNSNQAQGELKTSHSQSLLEEYKPGELMDDFFNDIDVTDTSTANMKKRLESSDDEGGNPLVANDEDIEVSDYEEEQFTVTPPEAPLNQLDSPQESEDDEINSNQVNLFEVGERTHSDVNSFLGTGLDFMSPYDSSPNSFSPYLNNEFSQDETFAHTQSSEGNSQFYDYNFNMNMGSLNLTGSPAGYEEINENANNSNSNPWITNIQINETSVDWNEPSQDALPALQVTTQSDHDSHEVPVKTKTKSSKSKKSSH